MGVLMHSQNPALRLILCSDTRPTKFCLFVGALFWVLGLAAPGDTMMRPSFQTMGMLLNETGWLVLWSIYAFGMLWYTFRHMHWIIAAIINVLGLGLWSIYTLAVIAQTSWPWPAGLASDGAMFFAAFWILIRTGGEVGDRRGD